MGDTLEAIRDFGIAMELWGVSTTLDRLREEQWLAANETIASQRIIEEHLRHIRKAIDQQTRVLRQGFKSLEAGVDFQTHVLNKILDTLHDPSATRARELRQRGARAMDAGLYDDALQDLRSSLSENRYDFTCHFLVATIRLEHLGETDEAWKSCESAVKYARLKPVSRYDPLPHYFSSRCHVLMGRILEGRGQLNEALRSYEIACRESPDYGECFRRYALMAARLGESEHALAGVRAAVLIDGGEAVIIRQHPDMAVILEHVDEVLDSIRAGADNALVRNAELTRDTLSTYQKVWRALGTRRNKAEALPDEGLIDSLDKVERVRRGDGLLDVLQAERLLSPVIGEARSRISEWHSSGRQAVNLRRSRRNTMFSDAQFHRESEYGAAEAETKKVGCLGWLFAVYGAFALFFAAYALGTASGSANPGASFIVGVALLASVFVPLIVVGLVNAARRSARQRRADEMVRKAESSYRREVDKIDRADARLADLLALGRRLATGEAFPSRDEIKCSLILLDVADKRDDYDEDLLAQALQGLMQTPGRKSRSVREVKDVIRNVPAVLMSGLSAYQAEVMAALLRANGLSVGIKRRYVARFPPS